MVITGASSGIGRETAIQAGAAGARVVLASRNGEALNEVAEIIRSTGGVALTVVADVSQWPDVEQIAGDTMERFGRIDTWVNNAAVGLYSTVEQLTIAEVDQVIQVNLLGAIYGVKAAFPHMISQGSGTIINVASIEAERAFPLQAPYAAAKHGLKGFSEALRVELQREHPGVSVTLILPASVDTPFYDRARSKLGVRPRPVPPVYTPGEVAESILRAAEHPSRTVVVGNAGKLLILAQKLSPSLVDKVFGLGGFAFRAQQSDKPVVGPDNLDQPVRGRTSSTGVASGGHQPLLPDLSASSWKAGGAIAVMCTCVAMLVALRRR